MSHRPASVRRESGRALVALAVVIVIAVLCGGFALWRGLSIGPTATLALETSRQGIGAATDVKAKVTIADPGGFARLEIVQGDKSAVLAETPLPPRGLLSLRAPREPRTLELTATVGRGKPEWLHEGDAVLRVTAPRAAGFLRTAPIDRTELTLPVRLRPPSLEILSSQHYVRQGGCGVVHFRAGETAARAGVRVGTLDEPSYPMPGGGKGERFALFGIPWDQSDRGQIKVFAEDDAGNRVEQPFIDIFKAAPPRHDTIEVTDKFLEKVVPSIAAATPGFDAKGTILEQYLRINGEMRRANLAFVAGLAKDSDAAFGWSGPFLQMENSARKAGFAELREYRYQGRAIDHQTHLGLDLASLSHAPAPAPNGGKVVFAGPLGIYGNAVIIDHGYGLFSLQGHLSSVSVQPGTKVERGQAVGATGSTGLAGGDHLHLEMFVQGVSVDPVEWLDAHWIRDNVATRVPVPGFDKSLPEAEAKAAPADEKPKAPRPHRRHKAKAR